jgi:hypothetical protein
MSIYDKSSLILKLKFLTGFIQNLNRVNQNHSYLGTFKILFQLLWINMAGICESIIFSRGFNLNNLI